MRTNHPVDVSHQMLPVSARVRLRLRRNRAGVRKIQVDNRKASRRHRRKLPLLSGARRCEVEPTGIRDRDEWVRAAVADGSTPAVSIREARPHGEGARDDRVYWNLARVAARLVLEGELGEGRI